MWRCFHNINFNRKNNCEQRCNNCEIRNNYKGRNNWECVAIFVLVIVLLLFLPLLLFHYCFCPCYCHTIIFSLVIVSLLFLPLLLSHYYFCPCYCLTIMTIAIIAGRSNICRHTVLYFQNQPKLQQIDYSEVNVRQRGKYIVLLIKIRLNSN